MSAPNRPFRAAQALLTLGSFEFFGPILRDVDATHLLNPAWVGHARFHLMWLLGFMACSGLANLVLIWRAKSASALYIPWAWQLANVLGFWGAVGLAEVYGGAVVDASFHMPVFGINENVFVFMLLSGLSAVTLAVVRRADAH